VLVLLAVQQTAAAKVEAQEHLQKGNAAFVAGKVADAILEYEAATRLYPSPGVFYNLGQAYEAGDRLVEAVGAYERFTAGAAATLDAMTSLTDEQRSRVDDARQRVATLRARLGSQAPPGPQESATAPKTVATRAALTAVTGRESAPPVVAPLLPAEPAPSTNSRRKTWLLVGIGGAVLLGAVAAILIVHARQQDCPDLGCVNLN